MRLRKIIGLIILAIVVIYITGSYVAYADKMALFEERGAWYVTFEGDVYFAGGEVYAVITEMEAYYDATPDLPDYQEYFFSMFDSQTNKVLEVPYNNTFVEAEIMVTATETGLAERTLLKEKISIPYLWAGGDMDSDGLIYSFSYELGPYVAYWEYSPIKVVASVGLDIGTTTSESSYLAIEEIEKE